MKHPLKMTPGKQRQMLTALDAIEPHITAAAEVWPHLTDQQRSALLEHSPVLARFIDLAGRLESWQR